MHGGRFWNFTIGHELIPYNLDRPGTSFPGLKLAGDRTRPGQMSNWRTAWRRLTRAIHCPWCGPSQDPGQTCSSDECTANISRVESPTAGLRSHDLRHHAITELAESACERPNDKEHRGTCFPIDARALLPCSIGSKVNRSDKSVQQPHRGERGKEVIGKNPQTQVVVWAAFSSLIQQHRPASCSECSTISVQPPAKVAA
jgi:hypothetical protein